MLRFIINPINIVCMFTIFAKSVTLKIAMISRMNFKIKKSFVIIKRAFINFTSTNIFVIDNTKRCGFTRITCMVIVDIIGFDIATATMAFYLSFIDFACFFIRHLTKSSFFCDR